MAKQKKSKSTNKDQFNRLVDLLEEQPEIAKGFANYDTEPFWSAVEHELNSLGPPIKQATAWKKVWFDWKSNTKHKLAQNRRDQQATGGGPSKHIELTALEERVVVLGGLVPAVEGIEGTFSFGLGSGSEEPTRHATDENDENRIPEEVTEEYPVNEYPANEHPANEHPPKKTKTSVHTLLETQVENQTEFRDSINNAIKSFEKKSSDLVHYNREISKRLGEINQTMKLTQEEQRRHNLELEKIHLEKLKVKKQILEIELSRL